MKTLLTVVLNEVDGQLQMGYESGDGNPITSSAVRSLITTLGQLHKDAFPAMNGVDFKFGQTVEVIDDPRWFAGNALENPVALLALDDPRFGPLQYALPLGSAKQLRDRLAFAIQQIEGLFPPTAV